MSIRTLYAGLVFCALSIIPLAFTTAQELRIVDESPTEIDDPEAYRAYYGKLEGSPETYRISASEPFRLSVVILAPDVEGTRTDFIARVVDTANPDPPFTVVDGTASEWIPFFDTAGRDDYLAGPLFQAGVPAGNYEIEVTNEGNEGAYVLLIGEESAFSIGEIFNRYGALPSIKSDFFGKPAYQAFLAPLLLWPIIAALIVLAVIVFALYLFRRRRISTPATPLVM
jgi:hypothetical protein